MPMNNDYDDEFEAAGRRYNVDPRLLKVVFHIESAGNPRVGPSSAGALGGMQIMPETAKYLNVNPLDMHQAIDGAARYLAEGLQKTNSAAGALAYYHSGRGNNAVPDSTVDYVNRGLRMYQTMALAKNRNTGTSTAPSADDILGELRSNANPRATAAPSTAANPSTAAAPSADDILTELKSSQPTKQQTADTTQTATQTATTEPAQVPLGTSIFNATKSGNDAMREGFRRGFNDIDDRVSNWSTGFMKSVDDAVPALASLDSFFGQDPGKKLQTQIEQQNALHQQYEKDYGTNPLATAGRFIGNTAAIAPVAAGVAAALPETAVAGAPLLLRGGYQMLKGAAQGVAGAGLAGENPSTGAWIGAAIPGAAYGLKGVGSLLQYGGKLLEHPNVQYISGAISGILGQSIPHAILGGSVAQMLGYISKNYGTPAAAKVASFMQSVGDKAVATGVPGAAAMYQDGNHLQTQQPTD